MKSYLNTRQYEILSSLLKDEPPKTIEELSNLLHIKPRVIQYNLNAIDSWLKTNNTKIIRRSGYGLRIDVSKDQRQELNKQLSGLNDIELILSTEERRRCILLKMLAEDKPISSSKLGEDFFVSRTTILNDLTVVESSLHPFQLILVKDPHKGFSIEGHKSLKRFAMSALFCEEHFENKLPFGNIDNELTSKQPFNYLITDGFVFSDIDFANTFAEKIEHVLKVHYSQATRIFIYYYFLLLLADIRKNTQITDKFIDDINTCREFTILPLLKKLIEQYVNRSIDSSELQLLALHLHCQTPFNESSIDRLGMDNNSVLGQAQAPVEFGHDLLQEISLFLNPYLQIDQRFSAELITYLDQNLIYKKHGFSLLNPFHEKTRAQFLDTYDTLKKIIDNKKYRIFYQLADSNISSLTIISINGLERIQQIIQKNIRVALISDADSSLVAYTKEQITSNFPWFKIVGIFRQSDLHRINPQKVDLILSTIDLDLDDIYSIIFIDQFMNKIDIDHIKNWINENAIQKSMSVSSPENVELKDLLFERNIVFRPAVQNWEEAVYIVGESLVENGDLNKGYLDAIIQVNKTHGPFSVVSPHIALLHARSTEGVNNLCLGLLVLKKGVNFGVPIFDPVNLVFIIGIPDSHTHLRALKELANIIRTKEISKSVQKCISAQGVIEIIMTHSKKHD